MMGTGTRIDQSSAFQPDLDAFKKGLTKVLKEIAGDSPVFHKRLVRLMSGPYADNVLEFFEKTGRKSSKIETIVAEQANNLMKKFQKAAGADQVLSVAEIQLLPANLVDNIMAIRAIQPEPGTPAALVESLVAVFSKPDVFTYPPAACNQDGHPEANTLLTWAYPMFHGADRNAEKVFALEKKKVQTADWSSGENIGPDTIQQIDISLNMDFLRKYLEKITTPEYQTEVKNLLADHNITGQFTRYQIWDNSSELMGNELMVFTPDNSDRSLVIRMQYYYG